MSVPVANSRIGSASAGWSWIARMSSLSPIHIGVSTTPGAKALTVIPCSIRPRAVAWVIGEHAELRDAVRDEVPEALPARDRSRVDDLAAGALRDHLLRRLLRADDHAPGVDADDLLEVRLVDLHEVARAVHAGVVEDHVQLAERFDGLLDHRLHLRTVGDVDADRLGGCRRSRRSSSATARAASASRSATTTLPAFGGDRLAGRGADPPGAAGDDHDAVLYTSHLDPLRLRQSTLRARAGRRRGRRSCRRRAAPRRGTS